MGGSSSKLISPKRSTHWAYKPDQSFHSTPMKTDFKTYREVKADDYIAEQGVVGIGNVRLRVMRNYSGSLKCGHVTLDNVFHIPDSKERQVGKLPMGPSEKRTTDRVASGPGWQDTRVVDEKGFTIFLVRNGFVLTEPQMEIGFEWTT